MASFENESTALKYRNIVLNILYCQKRCDMILSDC